MSSGYNWDMLRDESYNRMGVNQTKRRHTLRSAIRNHFTCTFARHPFSRIVSSYVNKFDRNWPTTRSKTFRHHLGDEMGRQAGNIARNT